MTEELVELGALVTGVDAGVRGASTPPASARRTSRSSTPTSTSFRSSCAGPASTSSSPATALDLVEDLDQWLAGIASALKPGGTFLLYDHHPVTAAVDALGHWRDNYFEEPRWRLEQLVDAVGGAGLEVARLAEFQTLYSWIQRDRRVPWDFALLARKPE